MSVEEIPYFTFQELSKKLKDIQKFYPKRKSNIQLVKDINYYISNDITEDITEKIVLIKNNLFDFPLCPFCQNKKLKVSRQKFTKTCLSEKCRKEEIGTYTKNKHRYNREKYIKKYFSSKENLLFIDNFEINEFKQFKKFLKNIIPYIQDENIIIKNYIKYYKEKNADDRKITSKENYILRFGKEEGLKRFYDKKTCVNEKSIEKMKYSILSKNPSNKEYWINLGFSKQSAEIQSILYLKYNDHKRFIKYKRNFITDDGLKLKTQNPSNKEYWMLVYNYSEQEAIWAAKNYWNNNHNWRNTRIDAEEIEEQRLKTKKKNILKYGDKSIKASKASLEVFIPLIDKLLHNNIIKYSDYYIGYKDKKEYFIADSNKFFYSFDFTIPRYKVIIEFNGKIWHHRERFYEDENYKPLCSFGIDPKEKEKQDIKKINKAKEMGFNVLEIWDYNTIDENIEMCYTFIMENIK
jgi:very-short-patch-repair endonuclease